MSPSNPHLESQISVRLTLAQWECVAQMLKMSVDSWKVIPFTNKFNKLLQVNHLICDQVGLEKRFRCE